MSSTRELWLRIHRAVSISLDWMNMTRASYDGFYTLCVLSAKKLMQGATPRGKPSDENLALMDFIVCFGCNDECSRAWWFFPCWSCPGKFFLVRWVHSLGSWHRESTRPLKNRIQHGPSNNLRIRYSYSKCVSGLSLIKTWRGKCLKKNIVWIAVFCGTRRRRRKRVLNRLH